MRPHLVLLALFTLTAILITSGAQALWPLDYNKAQLWGDEQLPVRQVVSCEDGEGGSFVIAETGTGNARRVRVQRINHAGRSLWGPDGRAPNLFAGADFEFMPISSCPDGRDGVYYLSIEAHGPAFHLVLSYLGRDSFWARSDLGTVSLPTDAEVVSSDDGDAIVTFPMTGTLHVARVDSTTIPAWNMTLIDPFDFPVTGPFGEDCVAAVSDGNGGALVAVARAGSGPSPTKVIYQRVTHDGIRPFPVSGVVVDSIQTTVSSVDIEAAEFDAAFVVVQDAGSLWAHHVSGAGTLDWGSPVLLHNTAPNVFIETDLCPDGLEGLYAVACDGDLHLNRLTSDGNEAWGPGGLAVTITSGVESQPRVVRGPWSGVIVSWINAAPALPDPVRHLAAARLDDQGVMVWHRPELFREDGVHEPALLQAVSDGSGGAHLAWTNERIDVGSGWQDVWSMGFDAEGEPPLPRLEYVAPAASEYGQFQTVTLVGDYLDTDTDYRFQHESDASAFIVHDLATVDEHAVSGWVEPHQVVNGDYHAIIQDGPTELHFMPHAYTLESKPGCDGDQVLPDVDFAHGTSVVLDDRGDLHLAWSQADTTILSPRLFYKKRTSGVWGAKTMVDSVLGVGSRVHMVVDDTHRAHIVYESSSDHISHDIEYATVDDAGTKSLVASWHDGKHNLDPRIAIAPDGMIHIVYSSSTSPADLTLQHIQYDSATFYGPTPVSADVGILRHEIDASESGIVVVYEQIDEYPLYRIGYRKFDGSSWSAAVDLEVAPWIGLPDVAWDGEERILFSWHREYSPYRGHLLGIAVEDRGTLHSIRSLYLPQIHDGAFLASTGPHQFLLFTGHEDGLGMAHTTLQVRRGNGLTFGPPRIVHPNGPGSPGGISAVPGYEHVIAWWETITNMRAWECDRLHERGTATEPPPPNLRARLAAHPNPFNARTVLRFEIEQGGRLELDLFDVRGRSIARIAEGEYPAGPHEIPLVADAAGGLDLASGVYFAVLRVDDRVVATAKTVLVK